MYHLNIEHKQNIQKCCFSLLNTNQPGVNPCYPPEIQLFKNQC